MSKEKIILSVESISKQYRLGLVGTGSLVHDLNKFWHKIRGKEDPYLTIGSVNDRSAKANSDYVWALRDISFEVKKGEILGIIGKNGAGKSTLLKILSRVTSPTVGSIKTKGRIASLLEVGTGMHPELTGKENIFLNGAILGMTKAEISSKIDEIVDFSGCEMYIDTPVKRYSSGMRVRLGFAVAAFLEPDILVVDEVLAVGDAEFQKKAIGKMQDISRGGGRTVLFVSHNMASIQDLCTRVVVLKDGKLVFDGDTSEGIESYLHSDNVADGDIKFEDKPQMRAQIESFALLNDQNQVVSRLASGTTMKFQVNIKTKSELRNPILSLRITDQNNVNIVTWRSNDLVDEPVPKKISNNFQIEIASSELYLLNGIYSVSLGFADGKEVLDMQFNFTHFEIVPSKPNASYHTLTKEKSSKSLIFSPVSWTVNV